MFLFASCNAEAKFVMLYESLLFFLKSLVMLTVQKVNSLEFKTAKHQL